MIHFPSGARISRPKFSLANWRREEEGELLPEFSKVSGATGERGWSNKVAGG